MALSIAACMFSDHEARLFRDWYCSHVHESHKSLFDHLIAPGPRRPQFMSRSNFNPFIAAFYGPLHMTFHVFWWLFVNSLLSLFLPGGVTMALIHEFSRLQSRPCEGSRATRKGKNKKHKTKKQTIELREQKARKTKSKWSNGTSKLIGNK